MGLFFESMCVRDLRIYADALEGSIYHYRDSKGLECDAVLHLRNGSYGLIEIKLGGEKNIEEGAKNLKRHRFLWFLQAQLSMPYGVKMACM